MENVIKLLDAENIIAGRLNLGLTSIRIRFSYDGDNDEVFLGDIVVFKLLTGYHVVCWRKSHYVSSDKAAMKLVRRLLKLKKAYHNCRRWTFEKT